MKVKKLTTFILLALLLSLFPGAALGADLSGSAVVDNNQVTISGNANTGENVTICVERADGKKAYINQVRANSSGNYEFIFTLDKGEYSAELSSGGSTIEVPSLSVTTELNGPGGSNPGTGTKPVEEKTCYISIRGDAEKGTILSSNSWKWSGSTTVIDVLTGILDKYGISYLVTCGGSYVASIDGLAEKKPGYPKSGWLYKVNGQDGRGASTEYVSDGDVIEWYYTLDFSIDTPLSGSEIMQPEQNAVNEEKAEEVLKRYKNDLTGLGDKSKILNSDKKMTSEEAVKLKEILDNNSVSLGEEVGSQGGVLFDSTGEVFMKIPENSLPEKKKITVEEKEADEQLQKSGIKIGSAVYEFGPGGTSFDSPVTICIKIPVTDDMDLNSLTPAWYDAEKGEWVPIPAIIDLETGLVVFQIDHFTKFAVIEVLEIAEEPQQQKETVDFADVDAGYAWAKTAIEALAGQGIIKGSDSGFEPGRSISRAEMLAMLKRALKVENREANLTYSDVSADDWFYNDVKTAAAYKWMTGYPDGTFRPYEPVSRNEAACMLVRMTDLKEVEKGADFSDADLIPAWAVEAVKYVQTRGLMSGYPDGSFGGKRNVTRAEAAVVVYKYLETISG